MHHAIEATHDGPSPAVTDPGAYACLTCKAILNVTTTGTGRAFEHAIPADDNHPPRPVPAASLTEVRLVCDFCTTPDPAWSYHFGRLRVIVEHSAIQPAPPGLASAHDFGERWAACHRCATHIESGDAAALATRAVKRARRAGLPAHEARKHFLTLHQTLLQSPRNRTPLHPPRTDASTTATPEASPSRSPRAGLLPKVRDRLARYWRQHATADLTELFPTLPALLVPRYLVADAPSDHLAARLHTPDPEVLHAYTELMHHHLDDDTTGMHWIDPDYTRLAIDGGQVLPDLSIQPHQIPDPAGLIVWSEPIARVGINQLPIIAAQWGPIPDGVWITFFYPAEHLAPMPQTDRDIQQIRDRFGWLAPISTGFGLAFNAPVTLDDPEAHTSAAALVATWLLIRDPEVTETKELPADKPIRKAYQRAGRPAPTVRLQYLRPASDPNTDTDANTAPGTPTATATPAAGRYHHQFWVGPFWRNTWYGPGRTQREPRIVRRHRRGPRDAPFLTTPKVHVLGRTTHPAAEPDDQPTNQSAHR